MIICRATKGKSKITVFYEAEDEHDAQEKAIRYLRNAKGFDGVHVVQITMPYIIDYLRGAGLIIEH